MEVWPKQSAMRREAGGSVAAIPTMGAFGLVELNVVQQQIPVWLHWFWKYSFGLPDGAKLRQPSTFNIICNVCTNERKYSCLIDSIKLKLHNSAILGPGPFWEKLVNSVYILPALYFSSILRDLSLFPFFFFFLNLLVTDSMKIKTHCLDIIAAWTHNSLGWGG